MCAAAVRAVGVLVGLVVWTVFWKIFLILRCFLLPSVLCGSECIGGSSRTSGVNCVGGCFYYYVFYCSLVSVAAVCAAGFLVGLKAWIVCWRMFLKLCCFLLPNVCGGCVCSGVSSGTKGVDCVLEDVSKTMLCSVA